MPPVWSVPIPEGAERPFTVYVNGAPRTEGVDFTVEGRWLRFPSPLTPKPKVGLRGKILLTIGIGVYGDLKADTVDLQYHVAGRPQLQTDLPVIPPQTKDREPG
jgi:hypothetical protein